MARSRAIITGAGSGPGRGTASRRDELAPTGITSEEDIRTRFAEIMKGQFDPQEMIAKMIEVTGADDGKYRNVWPPAIGDLIKQVRQNAWSREA